MRCSNCGEELHEGDAFCPRCGAPVLHEEKQGNTGAGSGYDKETWGDAGSSYQREDMPAGAAFGLGVVAYLGWVGFIIALIMGDRRNDSYLRFHLNQSLVLNIAAMFTGIPVAGWIWSVIVVVLWLIAIIGAIRHEAKEVPILGRIHLI